MPGAGPEACQFSGGGGLPRVGSPGAARVNDHTMGLNTKSILSVWQAEPQNYGVRRLSFSEGPREGSFLPLPAPRGSGCSRAE